MIYIEFGTKLHFSHALIEIIFGYQIILIFFLELASEMQSLQIVPFDGDAHISMLIKNNRIFSPYVVAYQNRND